MAARTQQPSQRLRWSGLELPVGIEWPACSWGLSQLSAYFCSESNCRLRGRLRSGPIYPRLSPPTRSGEASTPAPRTFARTKDSQVTGDVRTASREGPTRVVSAAGVPVATRTRPDCGIMPSCGVLRKLLSVGPEGADHEDAESAGFGGSWSRLSESNRRPIHYE